MQRANKAFQDIVAKAILLQASDIHIIDNEVSLRILDRIEVLDSGEDAPTSIVGSLLESLLSEETKQKLAKGMEDDVSIEVGDLEASDLGVKNVRLRACFYKSLGKICVSFRILPQQIPSPESLRIPQGFVKIATQKSGLILVSGATGAGKSTTIASILEMINQTQQKHIICIQDPIEFIHTNAKSIFSYRQIHTDTQNFHTAILSSLRQDPDIISIGELRDAESIKAAILAAQTGHLVISTTHSSDCVSTIERICMKNQDILEQLASCLLGILAQRLCIKDSKRVVDFELLLATPAIKTLIRENKIHQVQAQLTIGKSAGMKTFDTL